MLTLQEILARLATFQNKTLVITPLSGGLTNTNYRVDAEGVPYLAD